MDPARYNEVVQRLQEKIVEALDQKFLVNGLIQAFINDGELSILVLENGQMQSWKIQFVQD